MTERARPDGLLPFAIDETTARAAFTSWVSSRHFAPRTLRGTRQPASIDGVFLPFWTFAANTVTRYDGERGLRRHRQVARTRTNASGQSETYWETESYIEWHPVAGQVNVSFPHVTLAACSPLAEDVPPWPLAGITPYARGAASGKRVVAYDIEPENGFEHATALMHKQIDHVVRTDIGGDKQRVHDSATTYLDPAYALLLLPAWLVSYQYGRRTWSVLINGSSGEVVGDRPYSSAKIVLLVTALAVATIVAVLLLRP